MLSRFGAYIITHTPNRFRHTLRSVRALLQPLLTLVSKMDQTQSMTSDSDPPPPPPPFNPREPAIPISYPLKTLEELESRSYFESFHFPFNKSKLTLQSPTSNNALPQRPRILVCHDMQGGYVDDKWIQGGNNPDAYAIWHWYLIDVFVYFSHNLVTLPPPSWTNTAHKHGVKVLGTFIMEWDDGKIMANKLLLSKESAQMYAERLTELATALGFDGWLINMEVNLEVGQIPNLKEFVRHLTQTMHSSLPASLVIWYDSVTIDGKLTWQNQLNENNKPFFDLSDGILVNYSWKENFPKESAVVAGERNFDVYMGIDVFGRSTYGGGQWTTNVALDVIKKNDVSAAIFAPGWVYESKQPRDFQTAQNRWWHLIEQSWQISQKYPMMLPFYSNFDQGHGNHFSVEGTKVSTAPWNNISSQSFQPFLKFSEDSSKDPIHVSINFTEASFSGGGNITFKGILEGDAYYTARLFLGELTFGDLPVHFTYSVKSNGSSLLGLRLKFISDTSREKCVFLASWENALLTMSRFSNEFDTVIMPRKVTNLSTAPGWIKQDSSIFAMGGYTLTEIQALCYMSKPVKDNLKPEPHKEDASLAIVQSEYYAVLGDLLVHASSSSEHTNFPLSTTWLVEGEYIKWSSGSDSEGSKKLSIKLMWKLKVGNTIMFPQYNIYVQNLDAKKEEAEYLGMAHVEAFYVADLIVPTITSSIRFIIQVFHLSGVSQNLEDSPYFQLQVPHKLLG